MMRALQDCIIPALRRLALALLLGMPLAAQSQTYPARTVKIIVPATAGGGLDVMAHILAPKLSESWGQPVLIENRPGANFTLGTDLVAKSAPDGYTLLFVSTGALTVAPAVYPNLAYNTLRDLIPVTLTSSNPFMLLVANSVPANSVQELLAHLRANPGKLNHAANNSASLILASEMLKSLARVDYVDINYKGAIQAVTSLVSGESYLCIIDPVTAIGILRGGRVRALAVTSPQRFRLQPDLPTMNEAGVPGYAASAWGVLLTPAKTPADIVAKLNTTAVRAMTTPEVTARFEAVGAEVIGSSTEEAYRVLRADTERWMTLVKERNIRIAE